MRRALLLAFLAAIGCGRQGDEQAEPAASVPTRYGALAAVQEYRQRMTPHIQTVGELQASVERQVGSEGRATSANLARAMGAALPRLEATLAAFDAIEPPPLLLPFHAEVRKLMAARLDAYRLTVEGWERESQSGDTAWQEEVEGRLEEANELILGLNEQLQQIDLALHEAAARQPQVAAP